MDTPTKRRFPFGTIVLLVVSALVGASTAVWGTGFDANSTGTNFTITAGTMPTPTGISCAWTNATTEQINWTGLASTYSFVGGFQLYKSNNGGAYSTVGSLISPYTSTSGTDTPSSPTLTNYYNYEVKTQSGNNWVSSLSSPTVASSACAGAISTPGSGVVTAELTNPRSVAFDSQGNMIIADSGNHCIREVAAVTGTYFGVSITAGNIGKIFGTCGTPGSTAVLANDPEAVALDSSGNLYFADTGNNAVREITTAGVVSTFAGVIGTSGDTGAGGLATAAHMTSPDGLAIDSYNNVFIADRANGVCRIRWVLRSNLNIYAAAGDGNCGDNGVANPATTKHLNGPSRLAINASDVIYIADTTNNKIRTLTCNANCNSATATFTSAEFAGTGTASYSGDNGAATSATISGPAGVAVDGSGNVYIGDTNNNVVREVAASTGTQFGQSMTAGRIYTIAGVNGSTTYTGEGYPATSSTLSLPYGVGVYGSTVYIVDTVHQMVRYISASNSLDAAAGNGTAGTTGDGTPAASAALKSVNNMATDSSNNVIIPDNVDHRVRKYNASTGEITTIAGTGGTGGASANGTAALSAIFPNPDGVTIDGSGNLYVADGTNCVVQEIPAANSTNFGIVMLANKVYTIAGTSTTCTSTGDTGVGTSATTKAVAIAVNSTGDLFISDGNLCKIRWLNHADDKIYTIAGNGTCSDNGVGSPATSFRVNQADGIIASGTSLYFTDSANNKVRELTCNAPCTATPATYTSVEIAGTGAAGHADGAATSTATFWLPYGIWVDGSSVYVADAFNYRIRKVSGGTVSTIAGTGGTSNTGDGGPSFAADNFLPIGITGVSGGGNIYFGPGVTLRKIVGPI